jgi:glycosyltransferase involved in cell wall biosynthesis
MNNNESPLLTIAIPTFNRAAYLELCLSKINEEIESLSINQRCLVKIIISDNASDDGTSSVISKYRLTAPERIEIIRNAVNIGPDKNITQCYVVATTPYVWVLGDDDVILSGGLRLILDVLVNQDVDIIYLEGYSFLNHYLDEPKRRRGEKGLIEYSNALDFVRHSHVMLTFLTALIVRTGVNVAHYNKVVEGTNLTQLGWVFPIVRDGKKFVVIKNRVYAAKLGTSGGYGPIKVFGNNLCNIANNIFEKQPRLAKAIQNGVIVTWFPIFILNFRKGKQIAEYLQEDIPTDLKLIFQENWRYYFFLKPLISLPIKIASQYYKVIRFSRLLFRSFLI